MLSRNKHGPLKWTNLLQVYPSGKFINTVTKEMENNKITIRVEVALKSTTMKPLWKNYIALLLNTCSGTSVLFKYGPLACAAGAWK